MKIVNIKKFINNILLSNMNIAPTDERRYKLILINIAFIVTVLVTLLFAIINTMQSSFLIVGIDILLMFSSFLGIYYLRKGYDVNRLAIFFTMLLFIGSFGVIIIRAGVEYTLVWSLLFPIAAIMLNGAKKGFYFSIVFVVMNFIIAYSFVGSTITMSGYIRFVSVSIIIIIIIYLYESTMKNVFELLKNSMTKVDQLNKDLELKVELRTKKLNDFISSSTDFVWEVDSNGKYIYASDGITKILGYQPEEIIGKTPFELMEEDEAKKIHQEFIEISKKKSPIKDLVNWNVSKNGERVCFLTNAVPVFDVDNKFIGYRGTDKDITHRKKIEYNLEEQRKTLEESQRIAHIGSWKLNFITNELSCSKEIYNIFEVDFDTEPSYELFMQIVHPEDCDAVDTAYRTSLKDQSNYEIVHRLLFKDARVKYVREQCETIFSDDGKPLISIGSVQDITNEKVLQIKDYQQVQIIEQTYDSVISTDFNGIIIGWNHGAKLMFGYTADEAIGQHISILYPQEELKQSEKSIAILKKTGEYKAEVYRITKSGDSIFVLLSLTVVKDENGNPSMVVGFAQDITKRKRAEDELKEQHKYLQSILDGIDDPIMVIREDYTVELMNEAIKSSIKNLNIADPNNPKCYEVSHHRSTPCDGFNHPCPLKDVLATKEHVSVVHNHDTKEGKNRYSELSASPVFDKENNCIAIIESARDITRHLEVQSELRDQKNILDFQAHHDALTGLPNRVLFNDRLEQAIETAKRNKTNVALLFIDLDHFKEINDSLGHIVGDEILKTVTSRLNEVIRKEDTVARLGGDEFTVVLENLTQAQDASTVANKILQSLSKVINIDDNALYVSSSIGISIYPNDGGSAQNLLKYADSAMYKAKDEGRNNFQFYSAEMTELAFERVVMETSLRAALENEEFVVYYQPQVNGVTDKLIGMEALVRWQHSTMGLVSPAKFIPLAELTGLIIELDRFVMRTAMTQLSQWYKDGLNPGVLAMNLAVKQLKQKDFFPMFEELIEETGCKPEWLELEITEGQIMTNPEEAIKILKQISDLGVELAIDDFGTGYSSLAYLKKLPIDKLKIDQAFVIHLPQDKEDAEIAKAVIALAKSLNLRVIAEGVETKEQRDFIVENGCENIQGYFYSKPIPADEMEVVLKKAFDT